ncbi:uncharacterized protein [Clytia hemisphaerica]|uniref:uncharacterized protein n=1 Tax=Clytia hemisphaerica TaxID=252671 RepID=UPI0034D5D3DD
MAESQVKKTSDENVCKVCFKGLIDEVQRCEKCRNLFHFDCCETARETLDHDEEERVQHICFLCLDTEPEPEETQENLVQTQEKHGVDFISSQAEEKTEPVKKKARRSNSVKVEEWNKLMNGKKNERKGASGASLPTSTSSKPTSASSKQNSTSSKPKKQFTCLKCGVTLARGGESYKKRHFSQSHPDLKESEALEFIVESNHQLAIARTKQKVNKQKISDNNKEQEVD